MPRKMSGSAIRRIDALIVAISIPSVVFESAIHLYSSRPTCMLTPGYTSRKRKISTDETEMAVWTIAAQEGTGGEQLAAELAAATGVALVDPPALHRLGARGRSRDPGARAAVRARRRPAQRHGAERCHDRRRERGVPRAAAARVAAFAVPRRPGRRARLLAGDRREPPFAGAHRRPAARRGRRVAVARR